MKYAQMIVKPNRGIFYLALCFAIIFLYACSDSGSSSGGSGEAATGTGSIAFDLVLKDVEESESIRHDCRQLAQFHAWSCLL